MKKLISILLIFSIFFPLCAEVITIDTSKGPKELNIPPQENLREAFIEMSQLYIEERFAHEDLIESTKQLQLEAKNYIVLNQELGQKYSDLLKKYAELDEMLSKRNMMNPIQGFAGVEFGIKDRGNILMPSIILGTYLFEKIMITTRIAYPWEFGIGLGFTF